MGALQCRCVAEWGYCGVEELQVWEGCGVGELRCGGVAEYRSCRVEELRFIGIAVCESCGVWKSQSYSVGESWCERDVVEGSCGVCEGVAECLSCVVWRLRCIRIAVCGSCNE